MRLLQAFVVLAAAGFGAAGGSGWLPALAGAAAALPAPSTTFPVTAVLEPGVPVQGVVGTGRDNFRTYVVEVPEGATMLGIALQSEADLDLFVRYGQEMADWEQDADYMSVGSTGEEVIQITATSQPPLRPGIYFIDVANLTDLPAANFELVAVLRGFGPGAGAGGEVGPTLEVEGVLEPGRRQAGRIEADELLRIWEVRPKPGTRRVLVGIYDATAPLDLVAVPAGQMPDSLEQFPYVAATPLENERLAIDLQATPGDAWWVGVMNPGTTAADYAIEVRFDEALPPLPRYQASPEPASLTPLERAVRATVQISTTAGHGSGTLLTPDGWILTNYHVVAECEPSGPALSCRGEPLRGPDGKPERVVVGLFDEQTGAARQYFFAQLQQAAPEHDLALLRIVSDLNGAPLGDLRLPFVPADVSQAGVKLGEDIVVVGYPGIAQTGSRVPLTVTRGIISGFGEADGRRALLLTDAQINPGNSGGLLARARDGVLVGVPSDVQYNPEALQKQNYARPLFLLPAEWVRILEQHGAKLTR